MSNAFRGQVVVVVGRASHHGSDSIFSHNPAATLRRAPHHPHHPTGAAAIRIAFCITELQTGGAERALVELAARIDRQQFQPIVYSLGPPPRPPHDELPARLAAAEVPVVYLNATRPWHAAGSVWRLARHFQQRPPDVVQTFLFHANFIGRLAARLAGVPHVVAGIRVAEQQQRWHLWLDWATSPLVDRYICVSDDVLTFSHQAGGLPRQKLQSIGNGVDLARFAVPRIGLANLAIDQNRSLITYVGRLEEQKRHLWLLRLMPPVLEQLPDHDLLIVGDGPQRDQAVRLAAELGLSRRVHFVGWRPDVPAILRASELLVLPSAWEGMPNVVLEAMAAGLPVVATRVEGVASSLGDAAEEQITAPDDSAAFSRQIVKIAGNSALAAELGAANQRRAAEFYGLDAIVRQYEAVYQQLFHKRAERG
ncbi:MAG: glycosyltransferase [Pirellulales bacterium]|nr:glycosyltransferase [Pirellulales bacterium]